MGIVEKKAVVIPLKAKSIHYSFFLVGENESEPPTFLPGVSLSLVDWPNRLVIGELLDNTLALIDLPDGVSVELVSIPGNRSPGNYNVSTPLMRFDACVVLRKLVRPVNDALELLLVIDCRITML